MTLSRLQELATALGKAERERLAELRDLLQQGREPCANADQRSRAPDGDLEEAARLQYDQLMACQQRRPRLEERASGRPAGRRSPAA